MFNVVIQVLDCLRLDRWREAMPQTQAALQDFTHLDNHWAVAHCSDPNHWALFHSEGPWHSGVTTQMGSPYKRVSGRHLSWQLQQHGYYTCAVEPVQVPRFYLLFNDISWHRTGQSSDPELRALSAMLSERGDRPFFYFGRSMTCHYPYLDRPMPPRGSGGDIVPLYDAAVAHEDRYVASLVAYLRSEHPDTIIVLLADHGELLGEHGAWDHLYTLWNILVRVPCALYVPGSAPQHTDRPTSHLDLAPTILDLLGLPWRGEGVSLAGWLRGEREHPTDAHRLLWLQGTGAGLKASQGLAQKPAPMIDPVGDRVLWRHRGVVQGQFKLVEDIHASGERSARLTAALGPGSYEEGTELIYGRVARKLSGRLPRVPDYQDFELPYVAGWRKRQAMADRAILNRLRALGYA